MYVREEWSVGMYVDLLFWNRTLYGSCKIFLWAWSNLQGNGPCFFFYGPNHRAISKPAGAWNWVFTIGSEFWKVALLDLWLPPFDPFPSTTPITVSLSLSLNLVRTPLCMHFPRICVVVEYTHTLGGVWIVNSQARNQILGFARNQREPLTISHL